MEVANLIQISVCLFDLSDLLAKAVHSVAIAKRIRLYLYSFSQGAEKRASRYPAPHMTEPLVNKGTGFTAISCDRERDSKVDHGIADLLHRSVSCFKHTDRLTKV